jgi:prevent-host-death family protein
MNISLSNAKARLSKLVDRAASGEGMVIERHGKPVARLTAEPAVELPLDVEAIERLRQNLPKSSTPAGETVRKMRDMSRY